MWITRKQYDWLITNRWAWMTENWIRYIRRWNFGGVYVKASEGMIENLRHQLQEG